MTTCVAYGYDSATGAPNLVDGPRAPESGGACTPGLGGPLDPKTTYYIYGATVVNGAYQVGSETRVTAGTPLQTSYSLYTRTGVPSRVDPPDHATTVLTIDAASDRVTSVSRAGRATSLSYEAGPLGRLSRVTYPSGQGRVLTYGTDPYGHDEWTPARITASDAPTATPLSGDFVDDVGFRVSATGYAVTQGRTLSGADTTSFTATYARDDHQRIQSLLDPATGATTTRTYEAVSGLLHSVQDGAGRQTQYTYDAFGRVLTVARDAAGRNAQTTFAYVGAQRQPSSLSYPNGQTVSYVYDDFGHVIRISGGDLGITRRHYDERGNLVEQGEPNATRTAYTYDQAQRVTVINRDADNPGAFADRERFWYEKIPFGTNCPTVGACTNTAGRLSMSENDSTSPTLRQFYGYTTAGEETYRAYWFSSSNWFSTAARYDTAGRLSAVRYPSSTNDEARYGYNLSDAPADAERPSSIDTWTSSGTPAFVRSIVERVERAPDGQPTAIWYNQHGAAARPTNPSIARTLQSDHAYGMVDWRTGLNPTTANLAHTQYALNADGSIASIADSGGSGQYYQYDSLGRLTCSSLNYSSTACSSSTPNVFGFYSYDDSGNRLTSFAPGSNSGAHTYSYPAGSNRTSSWTRAGWTNYMGTGWGVGIYLGGAPGQRTLDLRLAEGSTAQVRRGISYFPSGRVREIDVFDARNGTNPTSVMYGYDAQGHRIYGIYTDGATGIGARLISACIPRGFAKVSAASVDSRSAHRCCAGTARASMDRCAAEFPGHPRRSLRDRAVRAEFPSKINLAPMGATGARVDRLFFYGPNDHLISMREIPVSPAGPTQYENYYWLDDAPVFRYVRDTAGTALERTFLYDDHLGTPRAAVAVDSTMATPAVIYQASREAFLAGAPVQSPGAGYRPVRLRFPGQWSDDGTAMWGSSTALLDDAMSDLSNNQAREYEPGLGVYGAYEPLLLRPDPSDLVPSRPDRGLQPFPDMFSYALSNPTALVDPDARRPGQPLRDAGGGSGVSGGGGGGGLGVALLFWLLDLVFHDDAAPNGGGSCNPHREPPAPPPPPPTPAPTFEPWMRCGFPNNSTYEACVACCHGSGAAPPHLCVDVRCSWLPSIREGR